MIPAPREARARPGHLPAVIAATGPEAEERFREFFSVPIRNLHTRRAYGRAVADFCAAVEDWGVHHLAALRPVHVAAHIEALGRGHAPATGKQRLAAIRAFLDWMVLGQVIPINPAASVRGPRHLVRRGSTPVLPRDDARHLLEGIRADTVVGLRDRALIGLMIYSFARVGAAVAMRVADFRPQGRRWSVRLHEKGSVQHEVPAHHTLEAWVLDYIDAAGIGEDRTGWLFRSAEGRTGRLTERPLLARNALHMLRRRASEAGIAVPGLCNHSLRATGITTYMAAGGSLETAQAIAGHASPRTTQLYDRSGDRVTLDEIERIIL
ncbi:tyrosine-type recombinase/integrase [Pseudoruegeria sp. SK021]|uniref:tyrosine-type recombinase/integrase n=1 Tax=Pseudoruegeria sp. SK021 TaxID=1933035 RepID=UPI000A25FA1C|nr:tyrosine-type recombinase/integrase [Pseudoruegeria sp. SK021]OSP53398.1 integrase [Pseudoruegeria sp. SK021]